MQKRLTQLTTSASASLVSMHLKITVYPFTFPSLILAAKLRVLACLSVSMCPPLTIPYPYLSAEFETRVFAYSVKTVYGPTGGRAKG